MRYIYAIMILSVITGLASAADVFNMGGTRNADGSWTGKASLEMLPVGNPGNGPDLSTGYGAVNYNYCIGKFEVSAGQYTEFLNAVAKSDGYGLYGLDMDRDSGSLGCNIKRSGVDGAYTYSVSANYANLPVNCVSYWDACRFCNWLHNGQPTGTQNAATTERGAYTLDGSNERDGCEIKKNADAKYWIPNDDEWYKAAYHKNDGITDNYWTFPTCSDSMPSNELLIPDPGNTATFFSGWNWYQSEVGVHNRSDSPYHTFDQGGSVWEWIDGVVVDTPSRVVRGGCFQCEGYLLGASLRCYVGASNVEDHFIGFRIASVPEPSTIALLLTAALGGLLWWQRR
jgi:formylglycine-generating enzyme